MLNNNSGRHVRTRTGCWTCRLRKKKCDETRPACNQCTHLKLTCAGYDAQPIWMRDEKLGEEKKKEIKSQMVRKSRRKKKAQKTETEKAEKDKSKKDAVSNTSSTTKCAKAVMFVKQESPDIRIDKQSPKVSAVEISNLSEGVSGIAVGVNVSNEEEEMLKIGYRYPPALSPTTSHDYASSNSSTIRSSSTLRSSSTMSTNLSSLFEFNLPTVGEEATDTGDYESGHLVSYDDSMDACDEDDNEDSPDDSERRFRDRMGSSCSVLSTLEDNSIQTKMPCTGMLDVNLVKLYVGNIFHVTYRALSSSQLFRYNSALILPMFYENKSFFHGCLSSSALHMTATPMSTAVTRSLKTQVYKHRSLSLHYLKKQIAKKTNYEHVIATICALISFEVYSRTTNWQVHVKAATDCVRQLNWMENPPIEEPANWFMFSRVIWLDILGALTRGRPAHFADKYRDMVFLLPEMRNKYKIGELIGCDDGIMFVLSEAICLEAWKLETGRSGNVNDPEFQKLLETQGEHLDRELRNKDNIDVPPEPSKMQDVEMANSGYPSPPFTEEECDPSPGRNFAGDDSGSDSDYDSDYESSEDSEPDEIDFASSEVPKSPQEIEKIEEVLQDDTGTREELPDHTVFSNAITASFRAAVRIYIANIVHGYQPHHEKLEFLLAELIVLISLIPSGPAGYDRSIVAPLLIGGSIATDEDDRNFFLSRCRKIPRLAKYGNLGSVDKILREVWARADAGEFDDVPQVPWREVMERNKWQYLLV